MKKKVISVICAASIMMPSQVMKTYAIENSFEPSVSVSTAYANSDSAVNSDDTAETTELKILKTDVELNVETYPTQIRYKLGEVPHLAGGLYYVKITLYYSNGKTASKEWHLTQDNYAMPMTIEYESGTQKIQTTFKFDGDFSSVHNTNIPGTYPVYLRIMDENKIVSYDEIKYDIIYEAPDTSSDTSTTTSSAASSVTTTTTTVSASSDSSTTTELKIVSTDVDFNIKTYPTQTRYQLGEILHLEGGLYDVGITVYYSDGNNVSKEWHLTQDNYAMPMTIEYESGTQKSQATFRFDGDFSSVHNTKLPGTYPVYLRIMDENKTISYDEKKYYIVISALGDINLNGIVDGRDATAVLTYYAITSTRGNFDNPDFHAEYADYNEDEIIDARDATDILTYYAKSSTGN